MLPVLLAAVDLLVAAVVLMDHFDDDKDDN